ncbi:MAG: thiamine phosphate synthase [Myxococcota bacterium]|jgi:thiamine-phosphate pyrophosphorylase|nr:thiamine phosphate synthase [Myxococcota bacterium]
MTKPALEPDLRFYGILTNPKVGYERLAQVLVARGVRFVQLRMKDCAREEVRQVAMRVRRIVTLPSLFILNDDPQLAAEVGADGVHLGQGDMPYAKARAIVGEDAIIGLSTHNPSQTAAACALAPDYIGVGPVFPTPTKKLADPSIGIEGMRQMLELSTVPTVVLGSLDVSNLRPVFAAGALGFASVRPINDTLAPEDALDELLRLETNAKN